KKIVVSNFNYQQFFVAELKDNFGYNDRTRLIQSLLDQGCDLKKLKPFADSGVRPE
ncbi:16202_t:CDS:1, partial [Funneliformis caledonium]